MHTLYLWRAQKIKSDFCLETKIVEVGNDKQLINLVWPKIDFFLSSEQDFF